MGTRAIINFGHKEDTVLITTAAIYHHWDGYPESDAGILAKLDRFFAAVEEQCSDDRYGTRFNDPSYLAAKFIVYHVHEDEPKKDNPLAFGGIGIVADQRDCGQEYEYFLDCRTHGRPEVYWKSKHDKLGWRQGPPPEDSFE